MKLKNKLYDPSLFTLTDSSGTMNLFSLSVPLFFQQIFTFLLGTVNTVVLTRVSGDAVTAVNVAVSVLSIPIILLTMPSNGAVIILSLMLGSNARKRLGDIYVTGLIINIILPILLSIIFFFSAPALLGIMNVSGSILEESIVYFKIRCLFLIFQALTTYLTGVLRAYGMAKSTMISGIIVNVINALLSIMTVSGLFLSGNKIIGVSAAAGIGQLAGMLYAFLILYKNRQISVRGSFIRSAAIRILKVGVPSGLSLFAYNVSSMLITSMIASLGNQVMNTKVFVTNIASYTYLFGYAMAQSSALMTGRLCGAKKYDRAKALFRQNIRFIPMINVCMSFIAFLFSNQLMRIFTDDVAIIHTAHYLFLADIAVEAFRGITHMGENSLCSVEDTLYTSIVSIASCFLISVLFCRLFCIHFKMGLFGYYISAMMDEGIRGLMYRIRWNKGKWVDRCNIYGKCTVPLSL